MSAPLFRTIGLEKTFGGVVAAKDISIDVMSGERIAIIGSNGAGKTTFVNMVTGYLTPSAGQILFDGHDITGLDPRQTAQAGIRRSFQIAQVFAEMTVLENMLIALIAGQDGRPSARAAITPERIDIARSALDRFGLSVIADTPAGTLPQGTRKQLDIAMAAVGDPRLVLLDEPTSGVSADEKMAMMDTAIAPLDASGATILFIEHDMDVVRRYADRVIAFYEGTVLADGNVAVVLEDEKVRKYVIGDSHA
ncbi:ABC transporter ATP-binding protein [Sagittula sp. NFXS13]|uniref:Branched-chain amino acid transport system ATP-binding protein n=1 Tax=Sagittula marina TaxID=943940 RepID=A0A7W6GUK9_9RHOB|nr:ABC transporter ATP-binding protein [Sagittula marina]MBB3988280.1 branched-chain amino acid transport system ATP-binding protein [Sagittula marina]